MEGDYGGEDGISHTGGGSKKITVKLEGPEIEGTLAMVAIRSQQKGRRSSAAERGVVQMLTSSNGSSE